MGKINLLNDRVINQIAAGEVVENPASVIKELVENSIDAGSTSITVEFSKGGTEYIRITDNGCGMDEDDAYTAFLRHATSKVSSAEDLQHISTMGFRGEALASISEVSHVELTTSTGDIGTKIIIAGGKCESVKKVGFPRGTTIEVSDLFFNTPARRKFLKSLRHETNNILELCARFILANPNISFKIVNGGRTEMRSDAHGDELSAICAVYGEQVKDELVQISKEIDGIEITGYVCKPAYSQLNRRKQSFFVNGRYVKSALIAAALDEAYKGKLMVNRFPFAVLYIRLPYSEVDVNVHPQKTEVRFSNSRAVFSAVMSAVSQALLPGDVLPEMKFEDEEYKSEVKIVKAPDVEIKLSDKFDDDTGNSEENVIGKNNTVDNIFNPIHEFTYSKNEKTGSEETVLNKSGSDTAQTYKNEKPVSENKNNAEEKDAREAPVRRFNEITAPDRFIVRENRVDFDMTVPEYAKIKPVQQSLDEEHKTADTREEREFDVNFDICGVLWDTYILIQSDDLCCIIDQHAAHERFLYDKYYADFMNKKVAVQQLLIPEVIDAEPAVVDIINENTETFAQMGFDIEVFGNNACVIRGVPSVVCGAPFRTVFNEAVELMKQNMSAQNVVRDIVCPELMKSACKHAVKGNQKLSDAEIKFIINAVKTLKGLTCPHGRPIAITISKKEMEKRFGRTQ